LPKHHRQNVANLGVAVAVRMPASMGWSYRRHGQRESTRWMQMESLDDSGGEILAEAGGPVGKGDRAGPWGRRRSLGGRATRRGMVSVKEMAVASRESDPLQSRVSTAFGSHSSPPSRRDPTGASSNPLASRTAADQSGSSEPTVRARYSPSPSTTDRLFFAF
jgi:hypothetical protein